MAMVKITKLLLEVDEWTSFTRHFAHLKSGDVAKDKNLLLSDDYLWRNNAKTGAGTLQPA